VSIAEVLQAGHAIGAGVAENCKDQTQQNCTSDVRAIAKLFQDVLHNILMYQYVTSI
jgi:hypothetical protein